MLLSPSSIQQAVGIVSEGLQDCQETEALLCLLELSILSLFDD